MFNPDEFLLLDEEIGWLALFDPSFQLSERLLEKIELDVGILRPRILIIRSLDVVQRDKIYRIFMRSAQNNAEPDKVALMLLSNALYIQWLLLLEQGQEKPAKWVDLKDEKFWSVNNYLMQGFELSNESIQNYITANPHQFTFLLSKPMQKLQMPANYQNDINFRALHSILTLINENLPKSRDASSFLQRHIVVLLKLIASETNTPPAESLDCLLSTEIVVPPEKKVSINKKVFASQVNFCWSILSWKAALDLPASYEESQWESGITKYLSQGQSFEAFIGALLSSHNMVLCADTDLQRQYLTLQDTVARLQSLYVSFAECIFADPFESSALEAKYSRICLEETIYFLQHQSFWNCLTANLPQVINQH